MRKSMFDNFLLYSSCLSCRLRELSQLLQDWKSAKFDKDDEIKKIKYSNCYLFLLFKISIAMLEGFFTFTCTCVLFLRRLLIFL